MQFQWINGLEKVSVHGFTISRVYIGAIPSDFSLSGYSRLDELQVVTIFPELPIVLGDWKVPTDDYEYFSYYGLSPANRGAFLAWVAAGAKETPVSIDYPFLYLKGLGYRLTSDGLISASERVELIKEIWRLIGLFGHDATFFYEAAGFLESVRFLDLDSSALSVEALLSMMDPQVHPKYATTYLLTFLISRQMADNEKISPFLIFNWWRHFHLQSPRSDIARVMIRCPKELWLLFEARFRQDHPEGIFIERGHRKLDLRFKSMKPILGTKPLNKRLPSPKVINRYRHLEAMLEECSQVLYAYAKEKTDGEVHSWAHKRKLPLRLFADLPEVDRVKRLVEHDRIDDVDMALMPMRDLIHAFGYRTAIGECLSMFVAESVLNLQRLGYSIVPDPWYQGVTDPDDLIGIYRNDGFERFESERITTIFGVIEYAARTTRGKLSARWMKDLLQEKLIDKVFYPDYESRLIDAFLKWAFLVPGDWPIDSVYWTDVQRRESVSQELLPLLVQATMIEGDVSEGNTAKLVKMVRHLGLSVSALFDRTYVVFVFNGAEPKMAEVTLRCPNNSLLEGKCQESEVDRLPFPASEATPMEIYHRYAKALERLAQRSEWTYEELKTLCRSLDVAPAALIKSINEWSFHCVNARKTLIEKTDIGIRLNQTLLVAYFGD